MNTHRLIFLLLAGIVGDACATSDAFPKEAVIHYRGYWGGFPVGSAVQSWHLDGSHYKVDTQISTLVYSVRYLSTGDVVNGELHPLYYGQFNSSNKAPAYETRFDWATHIITFGKPEELKHEAMQLPAQDLNALPYDLAWRGGQATHYKQLGNGHSPKSANLESGDAQTIDVAGNSEKTHYLIHHGDGETTEFWLADDWALLPVRIRHDGSDKIELRATAIEVDGRTLNPP